MAMLEHMGYAKAQGSQVIEEECGVIKGGEEQECR